MTRRTHWAAEQIERTGERYPKTRAELLFYLWYACNMSGFNIYKEGAEYTARIGPTLYATYLRTIDSLTFNQWRDRLTAKYFPF